MPSSSDGANFLRAYIRLQNNQFRIVGLSTISFLTFQVPFKCLSTIKVAKGFKGKGDALVELRLIRLTVNSVNTLDVEGSPQNC